MSIEIKEEKNPKIDVILNVALNVTLVSDLHREFYRHSTPLFDTLRMELLPQTRICVMAGDVGYPLLRRSEGYSPDPSFIHILKEFKKRYPVVLFVPGNHEYYQAQEYKASMDKIDQVMKRACEEAKVIFLNCNTWMDEETNCEFIGCTLWSLMSQQTWLKMNDSKVFSNVDSLNEKHISHVKWLTQTLTKTDSVGSMPTKRGLSLLIIFLLFKWSIQNLLCLRSTMDFVLIWNTSCRTNPLIKFPCGYVDTLTNMFKK